MNSNWPWLALIGLGAYHGINPAMGWLFAVGLGLQEKSRRAVLGALLPIAVGHALSIGIFAGLVWLAQTSVPARPLRFGTAAILIGFGLYRLFRSRHPKWVGMRVGFRDLTIWSFLMATAHGAGLMLVPVLLRMGAEHAAHAGHDMSMGMNMDMGHDMGHAEHADMLQSLGGGPLIPIAAVAVHTIALLLVAAAIALVVYQWVGLGVLRRAWLNLDLVWVITLVIAGVVILLV
jgi:hypothetical protein